MKFKYILIGLIILAGLSLNNSAYADRRSYVWTYEYMTMPAGVAELEYYLTAEVPDSNKSSINTFKHWLELEYGITDNLDIAMYQQFKQSNKTNGSSFEYDGFKLRTRYRIGHKNQFILDPLIYLEYIRDDNLNKPHVFEGKLILAKDMGDFNFAYNQILKQELETDGLTEHEYAAGANYAFFPNFKIGLESKGNYTKEKYYLGPTVMVSTKKLWITVGAVFGLNEKSDDIQTRMIVGVPF